MAKYPWGNEAFTMPGMMVCMVTMAVMNGIAMIIAGMRADNEPAYVPGTVGLGPAYNFGTMESPSDSYPPPSELIRVAMVSVFWVLCVYMFFGQQVVLKFDPKTQPEMKLVADRTVVNALEQAFPFLLTMWLHALFVNPRTSVVLGSMYVVFRYLYTIFWGMFGVFNTLIELSTQQNYVVVIYFAVAIVVKYFGSDLHTAVSDVWPGLMVLVMIGCAVLNLMIFMGGGSIGAKVIQRGVMREKEVFDGETDDEESS